MRDKITGRFIKTGEYSIEEATEIAFNQVSDIFYATSVVKIVRNMLKPKNPMDSTVTRCMRSLMTRGQIKYVANSEGVYTKL